MKRSHLPFEWSKNH
nr:30S ribosomal protein S15 [Cymbidium haematodes]UIX52979.1 30S ribosomal protein S15 [Cymbidium haematodes]